MKQAVGRRWVLTLAFCCAALGALLAMSTRSLQQPVADSVASEHETAVEMAVNEVGGSSVSQAQSETTANAVPEAQRLTAVERVLPDFQLQALNGAVWTRDTLDGQGWVINFWATWCPPCVEEIPSMNAAFASLEPLGIGMLAINAAEGAETVEAFMQRVPIDFPNVLGDTDTLDTWSVNALPTTLVVNAKGEIIYEALGPREWDDEQLLERIRAEIAPEL